MAAVKTLARVVVDALGVPLVGKTATLKNDATGATIATTTTDANGVYSFPNRDETLRYRVEVSPGGASTQVYRASPSDAEFGHLYAMDSLRTAAGAVVAFGGAVSINGALTVTGLLSGNAGLAITGNGTVNGIFNATTIQISGVSLDARYEPIDSAYTKAETDARYVNVTGDTISGALEVTAVTGATPGFRALSHVDHESAGPFAGFYRYNGQLILGASSFGPVSEYPTSAATVTGLVRKLAWYNSAGTFLGFMPLYSAST